MNKSEILNQYEFYHQATTKDKQLFNDAAQYVALPKDTYYFRELDACTQVALVGKGSVRVFKLADNGREITLYYVNPGEGCVLTSLCMATQQQYTASAITENDIEAVVFPAALFKQWLESYPLIRKLVFDTLADRTIHLMTLIEEITFGKMDVRLANFLLQKFTQTGSELSTINITHEQIAIELGTVREVVSRLLKSFENEAAISLSRGKIELLNKAKLEKIITSF